MTERSAAAAMQPHEDDVHALLDLFVDTVAAGASPTFATFKRTWVERHFSHVFEVRATTQPALALYLHTAV